MAVAASASTLAAGQRFLAAAGLNLLAVLDCAALPAPIRDMMAASGAPLDDYRRLVLVGHGGRRLWAALPVADRADPIDTYSENLTRRFSRDYLGDAPSHWLYPGTNHVIPLQQLGAAAGWSHPSPLGSGISPVFGVWFAYRAAFLTTADVPLLTAEPAPSPCAACRDQPCLSACPVGAVQWQAFDIDGCAGFRLEDASPCADRCLARLACPYFPEHRYSPAQMAYHYGRSLITLRAWYGP